MSGLTIEQVEQRRDVHDRIDAPGRRRQHVGIAQVADYELHAGQEPRRRFAPDDGPDGPPGQRGGPPHHCGADRARRSGQESASVHESRIPHRRKYFAMLCMKYQVNRQSLCAARFQTCVTIAPGKKTVRCVRATRRHRSTSSK